MGLPAWRGLNLSQCYQPGRQTFVHRVFQDFADVPHKLVINLKRDTLNATVLSVYSYAVAVRPLALLKNEQFTVELLSRVEKEKCVYKPDSGWPQELTNLSSLLLTNRLTWRLVQKL